MWGLHIHTFWINTGIPEKKTVFYLASKKSPQSTNKIKGVTAVVICAAPVVMGLGLGTAVLK